MKKLILTTILLSVIFFVFTSKVGATSKHNEWQSTYSEWGVCQPVSDLCGVTEGVRSREVEKVCVKADGSGSNECEIVKSCPNGYSLHDNQCRKWICTFSYHGTCFVGHYDYEDAILIPETDVAIEDESCEVSEPLVCEEEPEDMCPEMEGVQESELQCLEETPETTPSKRDEPENTFHPDTRCLDTVPAVPTWAWRFWTSEGYLANWSAEGGSKVDVEVTNGNGEYEYQYHGITNDGHEILPNVSMSQDFRVRTVNGCKKSDWLVDPINYLVRPFIVK